MTPLAKLLAERGLSPGQVAAAARVSVDTVQRARDGTQTPRRPTALRIAAALGVDRDQLALGPSTPLAAELARRQTTVRAAARAAGVHENSVYSWAAGKANPTRDKAEQLADVLGVPVDRLFPVVHIPNGPHRTTTAPPAQPRPQREPKSAEPSAFTRRLAEVMAARGLSAGRAADQAGVSRETIGRWLTGKTTPDPDTAAKVAAALDLPDQLTPHPAPATPLAAALAARGWTPAQLAEATGLSPASISYWTRGQRTPTADHAQQVAAALQHTPADLFSHTADHARHPHAAAPAPADQTDRLLTPAQVLARPATGRDRWQDDAACAAPDQNPDRWWPATLDDPAHDARTTCAGCPVLGDCRDAYLAQPDRPTDRDGVWAGLFGHQLRAANRPASRPPADRAAVAHAAAARDRRQPGLQPSHDDHADPASGERARPGLGLAM